MAACLSLPQEYESLDKTGTEAKNILYDMCMQCCLSSAGVTSFLSFIQLLEKIVNTA